MSKAPIQDPRRSLLRRSLGAGAVLLAMFTLTGCATNLTGFEFPRFGLTSDAKDRDAEPQKTDPTASQSLSASGGL